MRARHISNFVVASWTARLAAAIALAIGLLFAALVANAADQPSSHVAGFKKLNPS